MRSKKSPTLGQSLSAEKANHFAPNAGDTNSSGSDQINYAHGAVEFVSGPDDLKSPTSSLQMCASRDARQATLDVGETIDLIRSWHRQRCFAMEQRKRIDLSLGSFLRMMLGWSLALPDAERKAIAEQVQELMATGDPDGQYSAVILASAAARKPFDDIEAQALKEMTALAKVLPVWSTFGAGVRGFGAASLAVIIGEAGDLSNYSSVAKLWKRMGLAVMDGVRQGGLGKGAGAEAWIEHGYNPVRRSRMWNIGDTLIKGNRDGEYRTAYLARKEYELARDPECKPIKAHRRAQRYMEKRLLKHLWQAWRGGPSFPCEPSRSCSPLNSQDREAVRLM
jgi:hypothetical protein